MSIWKNIKNYASQIGLTYNAVGKTYNQALVNYSGKVGTKWINRTPKH